MRRTVVGVVTLVVPAMLSAQAQQGAALSPNQQLAHDIYKQLVEINTVDRANHFLCAKETITRQWKVLYETAHL